MKLRSLIVSSLIGLSLAACNAGSTLPSSSGVSTPSTTTTQAVNVVGDGTTSTPIAVAAASGVSSVGVVLPTGVSFAGTVGSSSAQPSGLATFSVGGIKTEANTVASSTSILFLTATPTSNVTLNGTLSASFTFASAPASSVTYHVALFDGANWNAFAVPNAGTVSGSTVSFSNIKLPNVTLSAGTTYGMVLYTLPATFSSSAQALGQVIPSIQLADGATGTLTLPTDSKIPSLSYTAINSASAYASLGLTSPTTGTFVGALSVTPSAAVTIPSTDAIGFKLQPPAAFASSTYTAYYVTTGSPIAIVKASAVGGSSSLISGSVAPASSGLSLTSGTTYTIAIFRNDS